MTNGKDTISTVHLLTRPVLASLFLLCLAFSLYHSKNLEWASNLYTQSVQITVKTAMEMRDREMEETRPAAFTAWKEEKEQSLSNPDLGRSTNAAAINVLGSPALLFPTAPPLEPEDRQGCVIDRNTAQILFGSAAPVGSVVQYENRRLTVRGVVDNPHPVIIMLSETQETELQYLTLRLPEGVPSWEALTEFSNRHGLPGNWNSTDFGKWLSGLFSLLAPLLIFLSMFFSILKLAFSSSEFPILFFICLLGAAAIWFTMLWATEFSFQIPEELLPNKWSDFDFWGEMYGQKKSDFLTLISGEKTEPELCFLLPALRSVAFGIVAALFFPFFSRLKIETWRCLWLWCVFSVLLSFAIVLLLGRVLAGNRLIWLFLPFCFLCTCLKSKLQKMTEKRKLGQ